MMKSESEEDGGGRDAATRLVQRVTALLGGGGGGGDKREGEEEEEEEVIELTALAAPAGASEDGGGAEKRQGGQEEVDEEVDEDEEVLARRTMRKVGWRVLPLVGFAVSISQVEKVNIALAAEGIMRDLEIDAQQFGLATSLYFVPYATLEVPCALLAQRLGPRRGLGVLALIFGGVSMCTAASNSLASLLALRFLLGTVESGVFPFTDYITSVFYHHDTLGRALAEKAIWAGLMRIVMGPAGAFFLWFGTVNSWMAEWRWLLFLDGVPALITGVLVLMLLPSSPEECRSFLRPHEFRWLMKKSAETQRERARRSEALADKPMRCGGVMLLLRDFRILVLMVVLLFALTCLFGYIFFSPLILQGEDEEKKRSMVTISLLDAIPASMCMLANYLVSWISDRQGERLLYGVGGAGLMAVTLALVACFLSAPFALLYTIFTFFNIGMWVYDNAQRSFQGDFFPGEVSAAGYALVNGFGALGGVLGPLLMGTMKKRGGSYAAPLLVLCVFAAAAALMLLGLYFFEKRRSKRAVAAAVSKIAAFDDDGDFDDDDGSDDDYGIGSRDGEVMTLSPV